MKVVSNPENESMICELPNGDVVEVLLVEMHGTKSNVAQDRSQALKAASTYALRQRDTEEARAY